MRHLRSHLSPRAWRRLSGATALLVVRTAGGAARSLAGAGSAVGRGRRAAASQAAAQTPETFIQQARRALAQGRPAEAEALAKAQAGGRSRRGGRARARRSRRAAATTRRCGCSRRRRRPIRRARRRSSWDCCCSSSSGAARPPPAAPQPRPRAEVSRSPTARRCSAPRAPRRRSGGMQDANSLYRVAARGADPAVEDRLGRALPRDLQSRRSAEVVPAGPQGGDATGPRRTSGSRARSPDENPPAAAAAAEEALKIDADLADAHLFLAELDLDNTRYDAARERIDRVLEDQPVAPRCAGAARRHRLRPRRQGGVRRRGRARPRHQPGLRRGLPRRRRSGGAPLPLRRSRGR